MCVCVIDSIFNRKLCDEHLATEKKLLDVYEKLKEESRQIEQQRDQVSWSVFISIILVVSTGSG